jgi:uncharacterized protein (DUF2235 family)
VGKNIIICADGTGNTFDRAVTNVTHMIRQLSLDDHRQQVVLYDQGIGTNGDRQAAVEAYKKTLRDPDGLVLLPPPLEANSRSKTLTDRWRGLLFGHGLKDNVREMYEQLTNLYEGPDDRVFLFGFSRGAFAVRALAGLLYRCHLPHRDSSTFNARFERAWQLYTPIHEDERETQRLREEQRRCSILFLGAWDTVKSYGGLDPVILPHLRHNPIVKHVRHALALHERRAWFKPTTWGMLDSDRKGAMTRLKKADLPLYREQDTKEVWFAGCHSDVGGGDEEEITARIALRWMLGEAANLDNGVRLNEDGMALLNERDPEDRPQIHESWGQGWRVIEQIRRKEIYNDGIYPRKEEAIGSNGRRDPGEHRRGDNVYLHRTLENAHSVPKPFKFCDTQSAPSRAAI